MALRTTLEPRWNKKGWDTNKPGETDQKAVVMNSYNKNILFIDRGIGTTNHLCWICRSSDCYSFYLSITSLFHHCLYSRLRLIRWKRVHHRKRPAIGNHKIFRHYKTLLHKIKSEMVAWRRRTREAKWTNQSRLRTDTCLRNLPGKQYAFALNLPAPHLYNDSDG